jgi:hypothetical protein
MLCVQAHAHSFVGTSLHMQVQSGLDEKVPLSQVNLESILMQKDWILCMYECLRAFETRAARGTTTAQ